MEKMRNAKFKIGQVVKHRVYPFRGVIFDIDPVFNNTEEWWQAIPAEIRPRKDQPFYHLFAENSETEYIAYVSEQNLLPDTSDTPLRHPDVAEVFDRDENGGYKPRRSGLHSPKIKGAALGPRLRSLGKWKRLFFLRRRRRGRHGARRCLALLAFEFLAGLFRFLLQLFLQFPLLFLECLRICRRTVIRLGKIVQRQRQADRRALHVDRLDDDVLALFHFPIRSSVT